MRPLSFVEDNGSLFHVTFVFGLFEHGATNREADLLRGSVYRGCSVLGALCECYGAR